jgi:glutathione peroxidase
VPRPLHLIFDITLGGDEDDRNLSGQRIPLQDPAHFVATKNFCTLTYDITFPLSKIEVNGSNAHPLYAYLKKAQPGLLSSEAIKWNFTKFLVDRELYAPTDTPEKIEADLRSLLVPPS